MKLSRLRPSAQIFVCTNARADDDPLRSGCGANGPDVFAALKREALARGVGAAVWVTATRCLGLCPKSGCAAVLHPSGEQWADVTSADVPSLFLRAVKDGR